MRDTPWGYISYLNQYKEDYEIQNYEDEIDKYCKELNIDWFASAWDIESLKFLENYLNA